MREIKFRYGYTDGTNWIFQSFAIDEIENGDPYQVISDNALLKNYKLITREIFTGLHDDNDKEIYEGDRIIDINGNEYTVEWNDDTCKFQLSDGSCLNDGDRYGTYKCIVGNIYESK